MKSKIESMLREPAFDYLKPYFYSNPFALRCELGQGEGAAFSHSARQRAEEIWRILFPRGADAVFFSHWMTDWSDSGAPEAAQWSDPGEVVSLRLMNETEALRFLLEMHMRAFYDRLRPYFLDYDLEEMEKRRAQANGN